MMETVKIYFSDLNEKGQKKILEACGVHRPEEMNWDMDILPIAMIDFEKRGHDIYYTLVPYEESYRCNIKI